MSKVQSSVERKRVDRLIRPKHRLMLALFAILTLAYKSTLAETTDQLATNTYFINHVSTDPFYTEHNLDPNVVIHGREVVMSGRERTAPMKGKVLLLLPGAFVPGSVAFDLSCEDCSMMRDFAQAGWDVFTLDFEGYGLSTRPLNMEDPAAFPQSKAPIRVDVTVANVARVVEFIASLRKVEEVHVLGWSLAASCETPRYTSEHPDRVAKLVLFGGAYQSLGELEPLRAKVAAVKQEVKQLRSPLMFADGFLGTREDMYLPGVQEALRTEWLASDPRSGEFGGLIREPTGRLVDLLGLPCFEAESVTVPTLIIRGDHDTMSIQEDSQLLLETLGSDVKEYVEIHKAGHLIPWEQSNKEFYRAVRIFLERPIKSRR